MDSWYQGASTPEPQETRSLRGRLRGALDALSRPPSHPPVALDLYRRLPTKPVIPSSPACHPERSEGSALLDLEARYIVPLFALPFSNFKLLISSFAFRPRHPPVISNTAGRRFFFPVRSCEPVGLRREKSLFALPSTRRVT